MEKPQSGGVSSRAVEVTCAVDGATSVGRDVGAIASGGTSRLPSSWW
jgi:hypothetical protein